TKISGGPGSETSLRRLFSPDARFRLLDMLLWTWLGLGDGVRTGLRRVGLVLLAIAVLTPLLAVLGVGGTWLSVAVVVFYLVVIAVVVAGYRLDRVVRNLPKTGFGICPGANPDVAPTMEAHKTKGWLADWLHATIQDVAGREVGQVPDPAPGVPVPDRAKPLTVGDLWALQQVDGQSTPDLTRRLNLALTTTNLSHQLPHRFPYLERPRGELYFRPEELRRVLPEDVVRWLVIASQEDAGDGYFRLPKPADLPILLGIRLSLSFPILISAVPLHARDMGRPGDMLATPSRMECCWFSDGGITSNFPISAFDTPLPSRPTFCVNLAEATVERAAKLENVPLDERDDALVWMPPVDDQPHAPRLFDRLDGSLVKFIGAISTTARNAHENELLLMPGYRDRIVEVATLADEGGLNLNMPPATIEALSRRGAWASRELTERFAPGGEGWPVQRWVRFRSTMDAMERLLQAFDGAWHRESHGAPTFAELRGRWANADALSCYPWPDEDTAKSADRVVEAVLGLARTLDGEAEGLGARIFDRPGSERGAAPRPPLDLKMRPTGRDPDAPAGTAPPQGFVGLAEGSSSPPLG
ncbi:MAG: hypothetical protein ACOCYE_06990, partial [Pseudomonadota bacterium]